MDEVPGKPDGGKRQGSTGPFKRPSSGGAGGRKRLHGRRTPAKGGDTPHQSTRIQGNQGIGPYHRRGMRLSKKFVLLISLLIIAISGLFGFGSVMVFQYQMKQDIIRYGSERAMGLKVFARDVYENYIADKEYADPNNEDRAKAVKYLENIVANEKRIYGIAIFSFAKWKGQVASPDPNVAIISAGVIPKEFTRPGRSILAMDLPDVDQELQVWPSEMKVKDKYVECLHFRIPTEMQGENRLATVYLAISQATIKDAVNGLIGPIVLVGLVFVGLGLAVARLLANAVTRPVIGLMQDMDMVARGDLDHHVRVQSQDEIGVLARALNTMVRGLREAKGKEEQVQRLNADLNLAQEIMMDLLPKKNPNIPGYDIYPKYISAREVGGDYYDFIPVDDRHLALVIADVSGKSVGGALWASTTRTILRLMAPLNLSPADVLSKTNFHIYRDIRRGMFVTAMYVLLDVVTREITVSSAGHNPMVIWRSKTGEQEWVNPNGIALGFDKGPLFDRTIMEAKVKLEMGDRVVIYTDGVVEAMNEHGEAWGDDALRAFISTHSKLRSQEFCSLLIEKLEAHKGRADQHDDITFTTFRVIGKE